MALLALAKDVKVWVFLAVLLGLLVGFDSPHTSVMLMGVLIVQMILNLHGMRIEKEDFGKYRKGAIIGVICCFVINTALTLAIGSLFITDTSLWYGWVMLASMPCAVGNITLCLYLKGDMKLGMYAFTAIYVAALALTPLLTYLLIGEAVNPLEVLLYIVLFIVVPVIVDIPLNKVPVTRDVKVIVINITMFLMTFMSIGSKRDFIFAAPDTVGIIVLAALARSFVFSIVVIGVLKYAHTPRKDAIVYMTMSCWKNTGMSVSMCMVMLCGLYPTAVLPCVICLAVEVVWFAFVDWYVPRNWPEARTP